MEWVLFLVYIDIIVIMVGFVGGTSKREFGGYFLARFGRQMLRRQDL